MENGKIYTDRPQERYKKKDSKKLHPYGNLEYCIFENPKFSNESGVYAVFINSETIPVYIGKAKDFQCRWSSSNYGRISPRNCYEKGQSTNCRINNLILKEIKENKNTVNLYFCKAYDFSKLEKELIEFYNKPKWNINR